MEIFLFIYNHALDYCLQRSCWVKVVSLLKDLFITQWLSHFDQDAAELKLKFTLFSNVSRIQSTEETIQCLCYSGSDRTVKIKCINKWTDIMHNHNIGREFTELEEKEIHKSNCMWNEMCKLSNTVQKNNVELVMTTVWGLLWKHWTAQKKMHNYIL